MRAAAVFMLGLAAVFTYVGTLDGSNPAAWGCAMIFAVLGVEAWRFR